MDRCTICGSDFSAASFGGPGICPTCDCGVQPVAIQKAVIEQLRIELDSKQAKIDMLMLEYCPEEMTQAQKDEWAANQVPANSADLQEALMDNHNAK